MHPLLRRPLAVLTTLALASCGTNPDGEPSPAGSVSPLDTEIAAQLYAGAPRTPAGFLDDSAPPSYAQVTTFHLKSQQLDAAAATSHELCSDDWTEALAWSETVAQQAPVYLDLVGNEQTPRYYEIDRVPRGSPEQYVRMRVFRCSYLDRTGTSLDPTSDAAGTLNHRPLDAAALAELSEYLWRFTAYNNADHAVLASAPAVAATGLAHALTLASLRRGAGAGGCDRVVVHDWTHSADATTGALRHTDTAVRHFDVRREAGVVFAC